MQHVKLFLWDQIEFCNAILKEDQQSEIALKAKEANAAAVRLYKLCDTPKENAPEFRHAVLPILQRALKLLKQGNPGVIREEKIYVVRAAIKEIKSLA